MQITGTYHLTTTEKRHIKQIIANGWTQGGTKCKFYKMEKTENGFSGVVTTHERNDWGKPVDRTQRFEVVV